MHTRIHRLPVSVTLDNGGNQKPSELVQYDALTKRRVTFKATMKSVGVFAVLMLGVPDSEGGAITTLANDPSKVNSNGATYLMNDTPFGTPNSLGGSTSTMAFPIHKGIFDGDNGGIVGNIPLAFTQTNSSTGEIDTNVLSLPDIGLNLYIWTSLANLNSSLTGSTAAADQAISLGLLAQDLTNIPTLGATALPQGLNPATGSGYVGLIRDFQFSSNESLEGLLPGQEFYFAVVPQYQSVVFGAPFNIFVYSIEAYPDGNSFESLYYAPFFGAGTPRSFNDAINISSNYAALSLSTLPGGGGTTSVPDSGSTGSLALGLVTIAALVSGLKRRSQVRLQNSSIFNENI